MLLPSVRSCLKCLRPPAAWSDLGSARSPQVQEHMMGHAAGNIRNLFEDRIRHAAVIVVDCRSMKLPYSITARGSRSKFESAGINNV